MWRYESIYDVIAFDNSELYHHGTKGMRWGVRRYQNKDGSLTPAGKKRRSLGQTIHDHRVTKKRRAAAEKARATRAKNLEAEAKRKKALEKGTLSVKKMTDDELASALKRLENEQRYTQKVLETSTMKRFMHKTWNDAVVPGITEGGKALVKDFLIKKGSTALGLNEKKVKSEYEKLKEANDMSNWKKNMQVNEDYFVKRKERIEQEAADRAKADAKKQVDEYNAKREKEYEQNRAKTEGQYRMKNDRPDKSGGSGDSSNSGPTKHIPGDTFNPGTSVATIKNNSGYKKTADSGRDYVKNNPDILEGRIVYEDDGRIRVVYDRD